MEYWSNINYLRLGGPRRQDAYRVLLDADIFTVLAGYDPVLVGTIPLDVDLPHSDLDILAYAQDLDRIAGDLRFYYGHAPDFELHRREVDGRPTVVCRFMHGGFSIEVFAQDIPVEEQAAYRHLVVEARLLRWAAPETNEAIRALKRAGLDTEAAFCRHFGLTGDPRATLLSLYDKSYVELESILMQAAHGAGALERVGPA